MTVPEASLIDRLCKAENPRELADWEGRAGYYLATCRVSAEDVPGLIGMVHNWVDPNWPGEADVPQLELDVAELLPVTAWRALADLKADAAVEPLVAVLCARDDEFDGWAAEELPHVFGKIGEATIQPLTRVAMDDSHADFIRSTAVRGLRRVAHYHRGTRDRVVTGLTAMMADVRREHLKFNTTLLMELVDLRAVQAAEPIERAFANDVLDVGMMGNWEDVRRKLGVQGLGLAMPQDPCNSIENLRRRMGFGTFSDRRIFTAGDIDDEVAEAYYERAFDSFSQSIEAQQVIERHGDLLWVRLLLTFGLNRLGETVDTMTPDSLSGFVLDYVPRKVSTDASSAAAIVCELTQFWKYVDRVYELPSAKSIVEWLETDGLVAELEAELSDSSNFGMAKSLFKLGNDVGYDMSSEADIAKFMMAYNRSLPSSQTRAAPVTSHERVGRNALCPCGSGKKFKKCCGRPS